MIFSSALVEQTEKVKGEYLKCWMGTEGLPLIEKWESTGKLTYDGDDATCKELDTYWNLMDAEFKPKANKIISIMELWNKNKQGSSSLNEWITQVYNMVTECNHIDDKETIADRIIRDVLIVGCNLSRAKDKIIRKGHAIALKDVIDILQLEESTSTTLTTIGADQKSMHYARYDSKKKGPKGGKVKTTQASTSKKPKAKSTKEALCYRCRKPYTKGHNEVCKAKYAKCESCQQIGHYAYCCMRDGKFPKKDNGRRRQYVATAHEQDDLYYNEEGNVKHKSSQHMLSTTKGKQELVIEFGCGKNLDSMDKKITMKIDTGADVNAINKKTFKTLFPDVQLQPSTVVLENFDSSYIQPMGRFKAFLRWKGRKYRIDVEVMDSDTIPNVLSWAFTFTMGILKPCFVLKKTTGKENTEGQQDATKNHPHSMKPDSQPTQMKTGNAKQLRSPPTHNINGKINLKGPLTKEFIKTEFSEVFEGLGRFPGEPYKLKLKPDAVPARHRPRKVPVHLEEAFHEEIRRLCTIDVLEPVSDHTEWVNSYVIVEKEIKMTPVVHMHPTIQLKRS